MTAPRVLIVGAGPAGLAVARRLRERGLAYDHVEAHDAVGGIWDIDAPGSPMYSSAHFISSKTLSAMPGHPMPADYPDYPDHRLLLAYLREFAEQTGVATGIRFQTTVSSVINNPDRTWTVQVVDSAGLTGTATYDAVIPATGMLHTPIIPELPGEFTGEVLHTKEYRDPDIFRGKRVLVVGGGNSGCDIVCDAGAVADRALISMRRGYHFLPKHIFGTPSDVFAERGPRLPMRVQQWVFGGLLRLLHGDLTRLGLQKPDHKLFEAHPLLNTMLIHSLQHGDVIARPAVRSVAGRTVTFVDGTTDEIDVWVWATGYTHTVPIVAQYLSGTHMPDLHLQTFSREHRGLMPVGFIETNSGAWGHFDRQARMVAGHLADWRRSSAEATGYHRELAGRRVDTTGGLKLIKTPRHEGYVDSHAFAAAVEQEIARQGWDSPTEPAAPDAGVIVRAGVPIRE